MYDRILIPTDGSKEARKAVDHGIDLAAAFGASVHALFVVESRLASLPSDWMREADEREEWVRYGEELIDKAVTDAEARGVSGVAVAKQGTAHKEIVEYANENEVDCIVMGTHARNGVQDAILGSVTERVVQTANVPVLTVRRGKFE